MRVLLLFLTLFTMIITVTRILLLHFINSSFIGVLWTPEVRGSQSAEEWLRRMQTVCFSPLAMINAWADGSKPWTFPEVEKQVQFIANLRMQLIPYLVHQLCRLCFLWYTTHSGNEPCTRI